MTLATPAHAAFPGANGKIAFGTDRDDPFGGGTFQIYSMNPDGTSQTRLTNSTASDGGPTWSPDGAKIAFQRGHGSIYTMNADGSGLTQLTSGTIDGGPTWSPDGTKIAFVRFVGTNNEIYTMNADGANPTRLTNNTADDGAPAWSPDGTKIAFVRLVSVPGSDSQYEIYAMNANGTGETRLTNNAVPDEAPDWSPDGSKIAFIRREGSYPTYSYNIYTMSADGTNQMPVPNGEALAVSWSPDGTKFAFDSLRDNGYGEIYTMNADGTTVRRLTDNAAFDEGPDWQPIPINSYPRPRGATPLRLSLVPANAPCTVPNTTHGAPLDFGSCAPPQLSSAYLTTGTPDSNGKRVSMEAYLLLNVVQGNTATPDVRLTTHVDNVLNKDLTDYTGSLQVGLPIRLTDKNNTPNPGGPGAATTRIFPFAWEVPCLADFDPQLGSDCSLTTTIDTLVPGAITEGRRAIWQIAQVRVFDGGSDGDGSTTTDNTVFAVPGVFVP